MEAGQLPADAATLVLSFSANEMTDPETFPSLIFYYGILTIKGTKGSRLIHGIPNNNVRKQYYNYILNELSKHRTVNISKLTYGSFCRIECAPIPYKHRHSERFKVLKKKIEQINSSIGHFAGSNLSKSLFYTPFS